MIVVNKFDKALPTVIAIDYEAQYDRADLESRAHVRMGVNANGMKALNPQEQLRLRTYKGQRWLARAPRWNGLEFQFAAAGKQGSAYELPDAVAVFIKKHYNRTGVPLLCRAPGDEILHILGPDETLPEGVTAIRPNITDPLAFSSEALYSKGMVVSAGSAVPREPVIPEPYPPSGAPPAMQSKQASARG